MLQIEKYCEHSQHQLFVLAGFGFQMLSHQLLTFGKMQAFRAGRRKAIFRIIHLKATITMFQDHHNAHIKLSFKVTVYQSVHHLTQSSRYFSGILSQKLSSVYTFKKKVVPRMKTIIFGGIFFFSTLCKALGLHFPT